MSETWAPDWPDRVRMRLSQLGYRELESFLRANPGLTYGQLCQILAIPAAPVQVSSLALREAFDNGRFRWGVMDCLCRELAESLPKGFTQTSRGLHGIRMATVMWSSEISRITENDPCYEAMWRSVMNALLELPPRPGWLPRDPEDPVIQQVFQAPWPAHLDRPSPPGTESRP